MGMRTDGVENRVVGDIVILVPRRLDLIRSAEH